MKDLRDLQNRLIKLQKEMLMRARDAKASVALDDSNASYYIFGFKEGCLDAAALLAEEFASIDKELNTEESPF